MNEMLSLMLQCALSINYPMESFVSSLPVSAVLDELLAALQSAPQVLLHAPTGAGKSTWLPLQILAKAGLPGRIIMLEPRRLAAKTSLIAWRNSWVKNRARPWAIACVPRAKAGHRRGWRW